ncbi:MAG: hypothetical protein QOD53_2378 [Thermoleophilaceae bacterium]|nr:hypothetical protein [Thermoleophilaceae bacterium]
MTLHRPPGGGEIDAPATLEDPLWLATGAMVATLLAHRGEWVHRHDETIELRGHEGVRRRVSAEFQLPAVARMEAPGGAVATAPLALLPKGSVAGARVRDESGAEVAQLPDGWSAEIAAAGLVAIAASAGASAGAELRGLAWRIASGSADQAEAALAELARGASADARIAWMHEPFRVLAQALGGHALLLVALNGDSRRTLEYAYDEAATPAPDSRAPGGLYAGLERRLGWDGLLVRLPLAPMRGALVRTVKSEGDAEVEVATEVDERHDSVEIRARAPRSRIVRLAPAVGLLTAVLLTVAWLIVPGLAGNPGGLSLVLAVPAVLAGYLAARPQSPALAQLVAEPRRLLLSAGLLALAAEVVLATGASTAVLRIGTGIAALLAWLVAALLAETLRRARGGRPPPLPQRQPQPQPPRPRAEATANATRLALIALAMGGGLMIVALADNAARDGASGAHALLWLGLLAIYVPMVIHAWRAPPRIEAIAGVVLLGVALYLVKVLHSPLGFTGHDEFSTLRTTLDIDRFGHAFHHNPLIEVHPFYPALELVTSAIASVTGLSIFASALVAIGVVRVALMAALFLVFEAAASARVAALATVLYACNPNFLFFDSQWAYESFALPLALVVIAMAARGGRAAWLSVPIAIALCISHPLTTMALVAFLLVWAGIDALLARREGRDARGELWKLALVIALFMIVWAALVARSLGGYLGPVIGDAGNSLIDLLLGQSGPKRIFGAAGVEHTAIVERVLGFAAVLLSLAALAFGARPLWRRFTALGGALGVAALVYPISLPLRLTEAGTEISNRASEFVFVGVAFLGALALSSLRVRRPAGVAGRRVELATPLVVALAAIAMLGGVVIGTAPSSRLPGRYLVTSDDRSVEPEGVTAAGWARDRLGTGNRMVTDRANALLMGSIGLQEPQVGEILGRPVPNVITAPTLDPDVLFTLVADKISYLVVDRRLATALPGVGFYFDRDEPGAYRHKRPPSLSALLKYDAACSVGRAFDSGEIVVYDTRRAAQVSRCAAAVAGPAARGGPAP